MSPTGLLLGCLTGGCPQHILDRQSGLPIQQVDHPGRFHCGCCSRGTAQMSVICEKKALPFLRARVCVRAICVYVFVCVRVILRLPMLHLLSSAPPANYVL